MMQDAAAAGTGISANNESLFSTLDDLYHTSWHMLRKNNVRLEDTRQLAEYVTQVRVLLAELERIETRVPRSETVLSSITRLKQRYRELEGMVKEVRNNLDRSRQVPLGSF
jgi:DNA repair ATPase RecN